MLWLTTYVVNGLCETDTIYMQHKGRSGCQTKQGHKEILILFVHMYKSINNKYLYDFFAVLRGVHWWLSQQDLAVTGVDVELFWAKRVVPQVFHVVPVPDNAIFHGVVDFQHRAELAGLIPHHEVLVGGVKCQTQINCGIIVPLRLKRFWSSEKMTVLGIANQSFQPVLFSC